MILADKFIENRKKNGWSQEELADKLGVSRQSVSKWESAQAVPDMKKVLQLAEIFNVNTDYLLKDEISEISPATVPVDNGLEETVRSVSLEEATAFLAHSTKAASVVSAGVMICILSPVLLILMGGLAEAGKISMGEETATMLGTAILIILVAIAVAMFIMTGMKGKQYEYLESIDIDTEYGVSGMARKRSAAYAEKHSRMLVIGIMMCIIAVVPLFLIQMTHYTNNTDALPVIGVAGMLVIIAVGVKLIVMTSIVQSGFDKLLEEGDYSRLNKKAGKYDGIYWAIATTAYLVWSFITQRWDMTWIVWPIAGVLFAAYREVMKAIVQSRDK